MLPIKFNKNHRRNRRGKMFIVYGPSGAGKNTLIKVILDQVVELTYVPSYTTRAMRSRESQGNPYLFVSDETFSEMASRGEFLEYETIHGNLYGTHLKTYQQAVDEGYDTLKDIDVLGALNFKRAFPDDTVLIYVRPTDINVLRNRLIERGDANEDISTRMERIQFEESRKVYFDYVVFNDNLDTAVVAIKNIIESHA